MPTTTTPPVCAGDYSAMSVDPSDQTTFWYTQEYYANTNSFDFKTRVCKFKIKLGFF